MSAPILSVDGLTTHFGPPEQPLRAVDGIGFDIAPGETVSLLGESGCGKSMTALSLMRLLPPSGRITAGSVRLGDTELLGLPESAMRRVRGGRMGMIFQEPQTSLNPVLTVGQQISEAVRVHGRRGGRIRERVVELLRAVGIPDPGRRVGEYPHARTDGGARLRPAVSFSWLGTSPLTARVVGTSGGTAYDCPGPDHRQQRPHRGGDRRG